MFLLKCRNPETGETWFRPASSDQKQATSELKGAQKVWPHLKFSLVAKTQQTEKLNTQ